MSQAEPVKKMIGDNEYTMFMLPPRKSHKLLLAVSKMIGPSLGPVIDAMSGKRPQDIMNQEIDSEFFSKAAKTIFDSLDEATIDRMIDDFAEMTRVDEKPLKPIFDIHFLGKIELMYKWLYWGMGCQWGKSLSALVNGIQSHGAGTTIQGK